MPRLPQQRDGVGRDGAGPVSARIVFVSQPSAQEQPHEGGISTYSTVVNILLYSMRRICLASYSPLSPMDIEDQIAALCAKVIAAPDGSEELGSAMEELRSALSEHAENLRSQIASLRQKGFPHSSDTRER